MNIEKPPFEFSISEDKKSVTITDGGVARTWTLDALKEHLAWLGLVRSQMLPAVERGFPKDGSAFYFDHLELGYQGTSGAPVDAGAVIVGTSPLYGHFHYPASPEFCRGLVHWLTTAREDSGPPPGTKLN